MLYQTRRPTSEVLFANLDAITARYSCTVQHHASTFTCLRALSSPYVQARLIPPLEHRPYSPSTPSIGPRPVLGCRSWSPSSALFITSYDSKWGTLTRSPAIQAICMQWLHVLTDDARMHENPALLFCHRRRASGFPRDREAARTQACFSSGSSHLASPRKVLPMIDCVSDGSMLVFSPW